jgi:COP9 signalosome complex subunit 5
MEASTSSATTARQTWQMENNIVATDSPARGSDSDAIFEYDEATHSSLQ